MHCDCIYLWRLNTAKCSAFIAKRLFETHTGKSTAYDGKGTNNNEQDGPFNSNEEPHLTKYNVPYDSIDEILINNATKDVYSVESVTSDGTTSFFIRIIKV